jgi:hypothetical protein
MARSDILPDGVKLGLTLDRYAELMGIPEAAFNGLIKDEEIPQYACNTVWKKRHRDNLAMYIAMAEETREEELGYHISRKYLTETHMFGNPITLKRAYVSQVGEETVSTIQAGYTLTYGNDPVTVSIATTVSSANEIRIYYPGEDVEIHPSNISISGGIATISIPKSRLVKPELNDDREDTLRYDNGDNFLETVDVKRVYYDETAGIEYIWVSSTTYAELTQQGKPILENSRLGILKTYPALYANGVWAAKSYTYDSLPLQIRVKYVSGRASSQRVELLTAKLAHTLMPFKPIDCEAVTQYWQKDLEVNKRAVITPYGSSNGAVEAWVFDSRQKLGHGGMIA